MIGKYLRELAMRDLNTLLEKPGLRPASGYRDKVTAEFVQEVGANIILRGIRDNVDLHFELQQANINMAIGGVETIFLLTRDQYALTSSTYIKQIVELGMDDVERLSRLVPPNVAQRLHDKFGP